MRKSKNQGFSLVEVVLALGVVAFAFVAILGLIPAGMSSFRQAINISVCSQVAQRAISDAFQADFDTLMTNPAVTPPGQILDSTVPFVALYRYFDEEGNEIISPQAVQTGTNVLPTEPITYLVITRIIPNITLPGASTPSPTASVTVQVVFDPGQYKPVFPTDFTPLATTPATIQSSYLLSTPSIQARNVLTFYAYITRN